MTCLYLSLAPAGSTWRRVTGVRCRRTCPARARRVPGGGPRAVSSRIDPVRADWGEVFDRLLDLRGYPFDRVAPAFPAQPVTHLREVGTVIFEAGQALDGVRLNQALAAINARHGESLWRVKGVLAFEGLRSRVVVQGVQGLLQANPATLWRPFEPRRPRLVLIGRALDRDWILARLREALPDTGVDH
jgi:G3E family GTPase